MDEYPAEVLTVDFYAGDDWQLTIYEDDGTTNAYENGAYSLIPVSFRESETGVVISFGQRYGEYDGMMVERRFIVRIHLPDRTVELPIEYKGQHIIYNKALWLSEL